MWGGPVVRGVFAGDRLFYWYVENVLRLTLSFVSGAHRRRSARRRPQARLSCLGMVNPTTEQVASVPIFNRLSPDDQALLASAAEVMSFEAGDKVFVEGEPANVILALLSGSVAVTASTGDTISRRCCTPAIRSAMSARSRAGPTPRRERRSEPTECLVIPRATFFALLTQSPTLVRGLVHGLTQRIVQLTRELRKQA